MKIEAPVFSCDVPGCTEEFKFFPETRVARVWGEAVRAGWSRITIREAVDVKGGVYYLIDLWSVRSQLKMRHGCPNHKPVRGRGTIVIPNQSEKPVRRRNVASSTR